MNLKAFDVTLSQKLNWHPERCLTFSSLVIGLIHQGNGQHHALSLGFNGSSKSLKSRQERIRRFFVQQS